MGRDGIETSGFIFPSIDGRVYLTPDEYNSGRQAAERLALPELPTGYFEVPDDRLPEASDPSQVEPRFGQPGGGREQHVAHPVDASDLEWVSVEK